MLELADRLGLGPSAFGRVSSSLTYPTNHSAWLIAAPYDTMENNIRIEIFSKAEEDRKRRLEDPIVFRATKVGIVIVSMWGEEASDSMFDKYR